MAITYGDFQVERKHFGLFADLLLGCFLCSSWSGSGLVLLGFFRFAVSLLCCCVVVVTPCGTLTFFLIHPYWVEVFGVLKWINKATDTHSEYVINIAFPQQQRLRERASMLRYTYTACNESLVVTHRNFCSSG